MYSGLRGCYKLWKEISKMKQLFLVTFLVLFSFSIASAVTYPNYNPTNRYVTDTAGVLDSASVAQISSLCAEIEKNTTVQIAVVIINSTEGISIEEYATELFERWGIGQKDVDNGLLVLVAVQDKAYRFEVGYGLEGVLNDAKVGRLGREFFVPNFQAGTYGKGIYDAVFVIDAELQGEPTIISGLKTEQINPEIFVFAIIFIMWCIPFVLRLLAKKYGKKLESGNWLLWGLVIGNMFGRGRGGMGGGGFSGGGFGGGGSGGGGASGRW
jgi:uncharacterized protein